MRKLAVWSERCLDLLLVWRGWLFAAGVLVTLGALAWLTAYPLRYNRSMEGFFPAHDPRLHLYYRNKEWFGGEATLLVVYRDADLWSAHGMERQEQLIAVLQAIPGVAHVHGIATCPLPHQPWDTFATALRRASPAEAQRLLDLFQRTPLYQGVFLAADGHTAAVIVQLQNQFPDSEALARCLEAVRARAQAALAESIPAENGPFAAGTLLMIHDVYEHTERDGFILQWTSVTLMSVVVALSFRSLRWVVLPLLVVQAALYWTLALWSVLRGEMTMVGSAVSSLVAVTGVATVVTFGLRYQELAGRVPPCHAVKAMLQDMGPPVFWILVTNAAGFAALLVCELKPVTDFAWVMVMASLFLGVAACSFLPGGVLPRARPEPPVSSPSERPAGRTEQLLSTVLRLALHYPKTALALLTLPLALVSLGMTRLTPQTDFTGNFRRDTETFRAYDFIETHFGGTGQLDLVVRVPDLLALDESALRQHVARWRQLQRQLGDLTPVQLDSGQPASGVTKVLGLADFFDFFQTIPGFRDNYRACLRVLCGDSEGARRELGLLGRLVPAPLWHKLADRSVAQAFWNRPAGRMRFTLQVRERLSSADKHRLIAEATSTARRVLGDSADPQATGIYVMLAHLIATLLQDQQRTFALATLLMLLLGWAAFRSILLSLAAMVPNALPILSVLGTMGWIGLPVNIATAMLASVALGMTINSSILYVYRFRQEHDAGSPLHQALHNTQRTAGLAIVISNLALVIGFSVLTLSRFIPLIHFGLFTGLALAGGMLGNLVLLPILIAWLHRGLDSSDERKTDRYPPPRS
mgnify:CR=1 FL=1